MLDAIKALFFDGSNDTAVVDERRCGVTVIGVDSENVHESDFELRRLG